MTFHTKLGLRPSYCFLTPWFHFFCFPETCSNLLTRLTPVSWFIRTFWVSPVDLNGIINHYLVPPFRLTMSGLSRIRKVLSHNVGSPTKPQYRNEMNRHWVARFVNWVQNIGHFTRVDLWGIWSINFRTNRIFVVVIASDTYDYILRVRER